MLMLFSVMSLVLASCQEAPRPSSTPGGPTPTQPPQAEEVQRGVTYCVHDDVALLMDVYHPEGQDEDAPAVIYLHAGTWVLGDRTLGPRTEFNEVLSRGYVVVSIDYRLGSTSMFPAQIQDAKCAVRHLRAEAERYGIDPDRIAAWGESAGGHIAALLGATGDGAPWDVTGGYDDQSSAVAAVVAVSAPLDLEAPDFVPIADRVARTIFGQRPGGDAHVLRAASPTTYASADDPPFLLIHGDRDGVVPVTQSLAMTLKLNAAGGSAEFVVVHHAEHGLAPAGGPTDPPVADIDARIADFLDQAMTD